MVGGEHTGKPKEFAMMQTLDTNIKNKQNLNLQQKRFIMIGGEFEQKIKQLSPQDSKNLQKYYKLMYAGFVSLNWSKGCKLGVAWQKAIEQMNAFVQSKTKIKNHPISKELKKIHDEFRKKISEYIMTNRKYAETTVSGAEANNFAEFGKFFMKKSVKPLNDMYKKYMPEQIIKETPMSKSFDFAKKNVQQLMNTEKQKLLMLRKMTLQKVA